jgi:glycosyltransferase involved in cell wall biosynthesis
VAGPQQADSSLSALEESHFETDSARAPCPPVAYFLPAFPSLRNTFVLREMDGLQAAGVRVQVVGLLSAETGPHHSRADRWMDDAAPRPSLRKCLVDTGWWSLRRPLRLLGIAGSILRLNFLSRHRPAAGMGAMLLGASHARRLRGQPSTHLHAHFEIPSDTVWVMHRLGGFSYSFTVHTDEGINVPSIRRNAREATFVATPSRYTERRLQERLAGDRVAVAVIRAAIPAAEYAFRPRGVPSVGPVRALCVAGLEPFKGHAILLKAISADVELERINVDIVGDGPSRGDLEELVHDLGLGERVRFCGARTEDEVRRFLGDADLFVLPSTMGEGGHQDNLPVALMEAMASGVPVVASQFAGIPELVADGVTGNLASPGDVEDLKRTLRRVLSSDSDLLPMTERARSVVEEEFDLPTNAARLAALVCRAPGEARMENGQ